MIVAIADAFTTMTTCAWCGEERIEGRQCPNNCATKELGEFAGSWIAVLVLDEPVLILHEGGGRRSDFLKFTKALFPELDYEVWHMTRIYHQYPELYRQWRLEHPMERRK